MPPTKSNRVHRWTFVTPPLSYADRLDCPETFASGGHYLQKPVGTRCEYGATETNGQRNLQRTVCRGPFTYSLPVNYGKLDPDKPDSARNVVVRPNGARWTVSVPDETQIGEVFTVTITIEGVHDIYFNNIHDGFQLSSRGAGCTLTKTVEVEVVGDLRARSASSNHRDAAPLAAARAGRPVASSGDYVPALPEPLHDRSVQQVVPHESTRQAQQHQLYVVVRRPRGVRPERRTTHRPVRPSGRGLQDVLTMTYEGETKS